MVTEFKQSCSKCGAELSYNPGQQVLKCNFCGAETEIPRQEKVLPTTDESTYVVPLSVDKASLERVTQSYMVRGNFTPDDLLQKAVITKQKLHYVPTYLYNGSYEAKWTASFGYDRQEHYTEYVSRTQNGVTHQVPVTRSKTVTDWNPASGDDSGSFTVQVYAGKNLDPRAANLFEDAKLKGKMTDFKAEDLVGFDTEPFAIPSDDAYNNKAKPEINSIIDRSVKGHAQGDHQRDWHWKASIDKKTTTVLMPVAQSIFEYEGKQYQVWIDGSDATQMVGDELPIDTNKKRAANLGYTPLVFSLLGLALLITVSGTDVINWWLVISAIALSIGFARLRKKLMVNYSKAIRNAFLAQKQSASANTSLMAEDERTKLVSSFEKPKLPILADTSRDKYILPVMSLACLATIMSPVITERVTSTTAPSVVTQPSSNTVEPPVAIKVPKQPEVRSASLSPDEIPRFSPDQPPKVVPGLDKSHPSSNWLYCESAKGYYPYVANCNEAWRLIPIAMQNSQPSSEAATTTVLPTSPEPAQAQATLPVADQHEPATWSPSYDCTKASNVAERLICGNKSISEYDVKLAQAYKDALNGSANKDALKNEQNAWRKNVRDACTDVDCLAKVYQQRIPQLTNLKLGD